MSQSTHPGPWAPCIPHAHGPSHPPSPHRRCPHHQSRTCHRLFQWQRPWYLMPLLRPRPAPPSTVGWAELAATHPPGSHSSHSTSTVSPSLSLCDRTQLCHYSAIFVRCDGVCAHMGVESLLRCRGRPVAAQEYTYVEAGPEWPRPRQTSARLTIPAQHSFPAQPRLSLCRGGGVVWCGGWGEGQHSPHLTYLHLFSSLLA